MRPRGLNRPLRRCELLVMPKLLGTIAAMLATLVLAVLASGAGWDTHGDFSAQSLSGIRSRERFGTPCFW